MAGRDGPHNYWREDVPPSRGQWQTIAELALELLGDRVPQTRLEGSLAIGTLRAALEQPSPPSTPPTSNRPSTTSGATRTPDAPHASPADSPATPASNGAAAANGSPRRSRTGVRTAAGSPGSGG